MLQTNKFKYDINYQTLTKLFNGTESTIALSLDDLEELYVYIFSILQSKILKEREIL